jgi:phosphohistidine phosphatase SixA
LANLGDLQYTSSNQLNPIMKLLKIITLLLVGLFSTLITTPALADLAKDLTDGQHVLMMRHADAPGIGDPPGYQLNQCSTQRNLGELGKKQSGLIGQWLKNQGITSARVLSSPWCRCIDTASLLNLGSVTSATELGSFFDDWSLEKQQTRNLEKLIKSKLASSSKTPLILVTHHVNIQAFTGKAISVGDMVLVKVNQNGQYVSHQHYPSPRI